MKKIIALVLSVCLLFSMTLIPYGIMAAAEEERSEKKVEQVLQMTFTVTADGNSASALPSLYSLGLSQAPESLMPIAKDNNGINGRIIKNGYVLKYDYAIDTVGVGLGDLQMQEATSWWGPITNPDLTDEDLNDPIAGKWYSTSVALTDHLVDSKNSNDARRIHNITLSLNASGDLKAGTTYHAYYRNIRIEDEKSNVVHTLFNPDVTPDLDKTYFQEWAASNNCTWDADIVDNPYIEENDKDDDNKEEDNKEEDNKEEDTKNKTVIKATLKFTNGENGTEKSACISLFGWRASQYADYKFGPDSKISYQYLMVEKGISGMGMLDYQGTNNLTIMGLSNESPVQDIYENSYINGLDMTKIQGYKDNYWVTEQVKPAAAMSYNPNDGWQNSIGHILIPFSTTEAVDTSKEYVVYYRNIRIVDGKGNTECVIFNGSQSLVVDKFNDAKNMTLTAEMAVDPAPKNEIAVPRTEKVIKLSVNYKNVKALQGKTGDATIFGYNEKNGEYLKKGDKICYDVMIDNAVQGLGMLSYQENTHNGGFWFFYHNIAADKGLMDQKEYPCMADTDLSKVATNKWYHREMPFYGGDERQVCHWTVEINSTMANVKANKTYNVYYKNIYIYHEDGSKTVVFDGSQVLKPAELSGCNGLSWELTKIDKIVGTSENLPKTGVDSTSTIIYSLVAIFALGALVVCTSKLCRKN